MRERHVIVLNIPGAAHKDDVRLKEKYQKRGTENPPDKTKILSNQGSNKSQEVTIDNIKVEVLPVKERAKYLWQTITFEHQETTEIKSRIRAS